MSKSVVFLHKISYIWGDNVKATSIELSINKLHRLACDGDAGAQNRLFQTLSDSFHIFAQQRIWDKGDVEEIVQDTLMLITSKYREIEFETSFSAWAYQVLENKMMSHHRTRTGREKKLQQMTDEYQSAPKNIPNPTFRIKLRDCLKAVGKINNRYARIINLSYQGYRVPEICERLRVTRQNMYNLLSRARRMLKICLEKGSV